MEELVQKCQAPGLWSVLCSQKWSWYLTQGIDSISCVFSVHPASFPCMHIIHVCLIIHDGLQSIWGKEQRQIEV